MSNIRLDDDDVKKLCLDMKILRHLLEYGWDGCCGSNWRWGVCRAPHSICTSTQPRTSKLVITFKAVFQKYLKERELGKSAFKGAATNDGLILLPRTSGIIPGGIISQVRPPVPTTTTITPHMEWK